MADPDGIEEVRDFLMNQGRIWKVVPVGGGKRWLDGDALMCLVRLG